MGAFLWPCSLLHLELRGPVVFSLLGQQETSVAQIDHSEVSVPSLATSSICLSLTCPSIYLSIIHPSTCPSIHACIYPSIHPAVYSSSCPSIYLSICLSASGEKRQEVASVRQGKKSFIWVIYCLEVKESECGGLNVFGPHKLTGNGTIRRCGFAGVGMTLLEQVCHCGGGL